MRNLTTFNVLACAFLFLVAVMWWYGASAATGIYQGEENSGLNKICYYHTPNGTVAITIRSHQVCPRSINL